MPTPANATSLPRGTPTGRAYWLGGGLLVAPAVAAWRLLPTQTAQMVLSWMLLISIATFALYVWDKRRARQGGQRVAENHLHLLALLGGWPGAFLAQRRVRHKTAKQSFQFIFWLIVMLHQYVAIDALLGWRLFAQMRTLLE